MSAIDDALYGIFRETLSEIYETVVVAIDPDSPITFSHLSEIVRKEHAELAKLRAENARLRTELAALIAEVKKLKAHLSPDGEYAIRRADGGAMLITETMLLGGIMDNIDAMLELDVTPQELSTRKERKESNDGNKAGPERCA